VLLKSHLGAVVGGHATLEIVARFGVDIGHHLMLCTKGKESGREGEKPPKMVE